jgi:hypothetical protein
VSYSAVYVVASNKNKAGGGFEQKAVDDLMS